MRARTGPWRVDGGGRRRCLLTLTLSSSVSKSEVLRLTRISERAVALPAPGQESGGGKWPILNRYLAVSHISILQHLGFKDYLKIVFDRTSLILSKASFTLSLSDLCEGKYNGLKKPLGQGTLSTRTRLIFDLLEKFEKCDR